MAGTAVGSDSCREHELKRWPRRLALKHKRRGLMTLLAFQRWRTVLVAQRKQGFVMIKLVSLRPIFLVVAISARAFTGLFCELFFVNVFVAAHAKLFLERIVPTVDAHFVLQMTFIAGDLHVFSHEGETRRIVIDLCPENDLPA
jgi:hypothetical protein